MMFMNEYDIADARARWGRGDTPNLGFGAEVLHRLKEWTNDNSDGWVDWPKPFKEWTNDNSDAWAYWPKPCRAAKRLQELLQGADRYDREDCTDAALKAALTPVKAFLTRQGVDHADILTYPPRGRTGGR